MSEIMVYWAGIGTGVAAMTFLRTILRDRTRLRVSAGPKVLCSYVGYAIPFIGIEVANVGIRPVTIVASGFEVGSCQHATLPAMNLPAELTEGKSLTCLADYRDGEVRSICARGTRAWVRDALGNYHFSKWFKLAS